MKKIILAVYLITALVSGGTFAQESPRTKKPSKKMTKDLTPEQRKSMAQMHEKMAQCLRSDKPMSECRADMHVQCMDAMGKDGCPMMGGMVGRGMQHGGMMDGQNDSE